MQQKPLMDCHCRLKPSFPCRSVQQLIHRDSDITHTLLQIQQTLMLRLLHCNHCQRLSAQGLVQSRLVQKKNFAAGLKPLAVSSHGGTIVFLTRPSDSSNTSVKRSGTVIKTQLLRRPQVRHHLRPRDEALQPTEAPDSPDAVEVAVFFAAPLPPCPGERAAPGNRHYIASGKRFEGNELICVRVLDVSTLRSDRGCKPRSHRRMKAFNSASNAPAVSLVFPTQSPPPTHARSSLLPPTASREPTWPTTKIDRSPRVF